MQWNSITIHYTVSQKRFLRFFGNTKQITTYLTIVQMTEATDDLLLVQLIRFELHTPDGLHGPVILQALLSSQDGSGWGSFF